MKLIVLLSLFYLILVSENVTGDLVRAESSAFHWATATVSCPDGKKMLGGGGSCKSLDGRGWVILYESRPTTQNSWIAKCDTPENQNIMAEAYIVCE